MATIQARPVPRMSTPVPTPAISTSVFQTNSSKYVRHRCAQISWLGVASEDTTTRIGVATRSAIAPALTAHKSPFCHNLKHNGR
jgi:hypothetical protein